MKKSILNYLCLIISIFSFSCKEPYKMQYTPGVTVDEEAFNEHKTLWENCEIKNYSYTYSYDNSSYPNNDCVIDVVVENDVVIEYVIKSYMGKSSSEMTEEEWVEWIDYLQYQLDNSTDFLRIDAIYDYIDRDILDARHSYSRYPDCYYANISAEYLEEFPFISYYKGKFLIMQEDLVGNGATIEIKIENFKEN